MRERSETDVHWDERAISEKDKRLVNIADLAQRKLESNFIFSHLRKSDRILEVGCGNGHLTRALSEGVAHVDAFDFSGNMIESAKELHSSTRIRFFVDDVLSPQNTKPLYDKIVCLRVLINLRDVNEQALAIENIHRLLKPNGMLLLLEGYENGFSELNGLRKKAGMGRLKPASINFYSKIEELMPLLNERFTIEDESHIGMFDFLTRIIYPALVGEDRATGYSDFHERIVPIAEVFNPDELKKLSRLRMFALRKK